jgi:hypothetical protein
MVSDGAPAVDHEAKAIEYEERARRASNREVAQGWLLLAGAHRTLARIEEAQASKTRNLPH